MFSETSQTVLGCDAAYDALVAAFGAPAVIATGFRWSVLRAGGVVVLDLTPATERCRADVVWMFDPSASGLHSVSSYDVNTSEGMACFLSQLQRLSTP